MKISIVGPFQVNAPFATEIAFAKGLRQNGHEVLEFDPNLDDPDSLSRDADCTLVFKSALEHNERLTGLRNVVLYQPDDLRFPHIVDMVRTMSLYTRHIIVFRELDVERDKEIIVDLGDFGYKTVHSLAVTADPDVYFPEDRVRDIDFCFVGSLGDRRSHWQRHRMVELLEGRGHNVQCGQTNDIGKIRETYCRSKVVLNHASDSSLPFGQGLGYQCRHFEVAMTRSFLMSNSIMEGYPPFLRNFWRFRGEESFVNDAEYLLENEVTRTLGADDFYDEVMTEHSPAVRARELVEILESVCV